MTTMTTKTKVIIGISSLIVLSVGGFFVWKKWFSEPSAMPEGEAAPEASEPNKAQGGHKKAAEPKQALPTNDADLLSHLKSTLTGKEVYTTMAAPIYKDATLTPVKTIPKGYKIGVVDKIGKIGSLYYAKLKSGGLMMASLLTTKNPAEL